MLYLILAINSALADCGIPQFRLYPEKLSGYIDNAAIYPVYDQLSITMTSFAYFLVISYRFARFCGSTLYCLYGGFDLFQIK